MKSTASGAPHSNFSVRFTATLVLVAPLAVQSWLFANAYLQPLVYDAIGYRRLADQLVLRKGLPFLGDAGFRSYGYPLFLKPLLLGSENAFRNRVAFAQCAVLIGLTFAMRQSLLGNSRTEDLLLVGISLSFPVLLPYCVAVLSDAIAVASLQAGLLLVSAAIVRQSNWSYGAFQFCGGLFLGYAAQSRPGYFWFACAACLASVIVGWILHFRSARPMEKPRLPAFFCDQRNWAVAAVLAGFFLACWPTMVNNRRVHRTYSPTPKTDSLLAYHLALGLWMDKWSSYDPPIPRFQEVIRCWDQRGWSAARANPDLPPLMEDAVLEIQKNPGRAAWQWAKHAYFGFEKWEVFPYRGVVSDWARVTFWTLNWLVLIGFMWECGYRMRRGRNAFDRFFAFNQAMLLAYLLATVALVVPEERYTLAVYPAAIVYSAAVANRLFKCAGGRSRPENTGAAVSPAPATPAS